MLNAEAWEREAAAPAGPIAQPITREAPRVAAGSTWVGSLIAGVAVTDALVLAVGAVASLVIRFGADNTTRGSQYTLPTLGIAVVWWLLLGASGARSAKVLGTGAEELRRITRLTLLLFGITAIVSLLFKYDVSRSFLALLFPIGLTGLLASRAGWRRWLRRQRARGRRMSNVLVIGGARSAVDITRWMKTHRWAGLRTTAVWIPDRAQVSQEYLDVADTFVPVMGTDRSLTDALTIAEADTVIVTDTEHLGGHGLKNLNWRLEAAGINLLVSPNVFDVTGSRLHLTDLANMPMLSIDKPNYAEASAWPKMIFDKAGAGIITAILSPLLIATAIAVKLTSKGPIFYRQERIGIDGQPFDMLKFRSMRVGADAELQALLEAQGETTGPLAKLKKDPRVTPIGGFIRRFSIDELPQILNVLKGDMSLVGPRPQRQFEVDLYDEVAHRRLRVRPGMTGLWQVSGRSDLSWEEAIRLDTFYVENWSMTGDLYILWRTVRAVLASDGAY